MGPPLTILAHRLEPLLARRLEQLTHAVEQGDARALARVERTVVAIESLGRLALPERRGALLTVTEMAERLGIRQKSLLRMVSEGRVRPAERAGRYVRFRGDERPLGPANRAPEAGFWPAGGKHGGNRGRKCPKSHEKSQPEWGCNGAQMSPSAPQNGPAAPLPYRKGWRAPWQGQWGGFYDGHTRLSYLARRIEREELAAYLADTPERARLRRQAARYLALVEQMTQSLGRDPKASVRRLTALQGAADRQIARLEALGARVNARPLDLARRLAGQR